MYHAGEVVVGLPGVHFAPATKCKVMLLPGLYLVHIDLDKLVPVGPRLFVDETETVAHLVDNLVEVEALLVAQVDGLLPSHPPQVAPAADPRPPGVPPVRSEEDVVGLVQVILIQVRERQAGDLLGHVVERLPDLLVVLVVGDGVSVNLVVHLQQ